MFKEILRLAQDDLLLQVRFLPEFILSADRRSGVEEVAMTMN
jgi:hypothetical protein